MLFILQIHKKEAMHTILYQMIFPQSHADIQINEISTVRCYIVTWMSWGFLFVCFLLETYGGWHWRNSLAVNNISRSSRELKFNFQHPNGSSQPCVTPVLRDPIPSSALPRHQACMCRTDIHTGKTSTDIKQKPDWQLCEKVVVWVIKHHLPTIDEKMCFQRTICMSHKVKITNFSLWNDQLPKHRDIY